MKPGLTVQAAEGLWLDASYVRSEREYDAYLARNADGDPVASETRRFEYSGFEVRVRYTPGARWSVEAGHLGTSRQDAFAGYLDTRGRTSYLAASRRLGLFHRVELYASRTDLDYDRATVSTDPASDIRALNSARVSARFERVLRGRSSWFATATRERADNRDPRFVYDRTWLQTGIRLDL